MFYHMLQPPLSALMAGPLFFNHSLLAKPLCTTPANLTNMAAKTKGGWLSVLVEDEAL